MFVVLKIHRADKRTVKRGRTVHDVRLINTGAGQCFYEVTVLAGERGVNWEEVASITGNHGRHLLLPDDEILPEGCPVGRFDSSEFRNILIFNTAELILKELFFMGERMRCVVNDPDGLYSGYIRKVVRFAAHTTVITDNELRYFSAVRDIYADMGAGVTLTDNVKELHPEVLYIDTAGTLTGDGLKIFSPFSGIYPYKADCRGGIDRCCPSYINSIDFLGAMLRLNKKSVLSQTVCRSFMLEGKPFTPYELARLIKEGENADIAHSKSIIFYV